ncbi:hypothetical protein [Amycolatopsis sp.]|jgi:hypothetical protein|uniref:hypothetical protein n=1 Tax=Amycolatopsis sp. TaxID=37632 RepID=UPI002DFEABB3|nr:hypothetical protein [Amycolatopsis sp.]
MSFPPHKVRLARPLPTVIRPVVVALVGMGLLSACGNPAPPATSTPVSETTAAASSSQAPEQHHLELEVTGTAASPSLTFELDGKVSEEKATALPWRKTVEVPYGTGRHEWNLTIQHSGGNLFATATVDGKLVTQTGGSGSPGSTNTATLNGSFTD